MSYESTGPKGINSRILKTTHSLTGLSIGIGQVENGRPGRALDPPADDPQFCNTTVVPAAVFARDQPAQKNFLVVDHGVEVAGVMISTHEGHPSVAPNASLYSSAKARVGPIDEDAAIRFLKSAQKVATQHEDAVYSINCSTLIGGVPDSTSTESLGVDWSARKHDTVYVFARGNQGDPENTFRPTDSHNGIVVAATEMDNDAVYRLAWPSNLLTQAADGRHLVHIIAPGVNVMVPQAGTDPAQQPRFSSESGTSFAAPHVAAVIALLQEYAGRQQIGELGGWSPKARHHLVMKAVVLNSADKVKDTGDGKLLGMEKTILRTDGKNWIEGPAYANPDLPIDPELGVGQLNAKRALDQFSPGEFGMGTEQNSTVEPLIGWDYAEMPGVAAAVHTYAFQSALLKDSYVSVSLVWDRWVRLVELPTSQGGTYDAGEGFVSEGKTHLSLVLRRKGSADGLVASLSPLYAVQHLFFKIPESGEYEFFIQKLDFLRTLPTPEREPYAVAWWAVGDLNYVPVPP